MYEDVDFESAAGVKFVISGVNWTMCRPGVDEYDDALSKLMQGMRVKGTTFLTSEIGLWLSSLYVDCWCICML